MYINEEDNVDLDKIIQWPGKWKCHTIGLRIEELKKLDDFKQDQQRAIISMQDVIHSNVLRFFRLTELDGITYVISDYCSKGSPFDTIHDFRFNFSLHFNISLALDIASGMNFLQSQNIIHGNLNSFCCLIDFRWTVKISDWEYTKMQCAFQKVNEKKKSRERGRNVIMEQRNAYDNFWVAPELLRCTMNVSSTASDVYSYAIVTQEIFSRQEPYDEHADFSTPVDVISAVIKNGLRPEPSTDTPITFRQIMEIAWSDNVLSRPTFDQICKMIQYAHPLRKSVLDSIIDTMEKYT